MKEMKSRVIKLLDITKLKFNEDTLKIERHDHSAKIIEEIEGLEKQYAKKMERKKGEAVCEGDVVTASIHSGGDCSSKYNKDGIGIILGKGFYDSDVEKVLIGKRVGESFKTLANNGKIEVEVRVDKANFLEVTPLTKQQMEEQGIMGISDEEELKIFLNREYVAAENEEYIYYELMDIAKNQIIDGSELKIDKDEEDEYVANWFKEVENWPAEGEESYENYAKSLTGLDTNDINELNAAVEKLVRREFAFRVAMIELGKTMPYPTHEEYERDIEEAKNMGMDLEQYGEKIAFEYYMRDMLATNGEKVLVAEIEKRLIG